LDTLTGRETEQGRTAVRGSGRDAELFATLPNLVAGTRAAEAAGSSKLSDMRGDADDLDAARTLAAPVPRSRPEAVRFPSLVPRFADRYSALRARVGVLMWLYVLVPLPLVADWIENGELPNTPRG
jgi:hypothetical protein